MAKKNGKTAGMVFYLLPDERQFEWLKRIAEETTFAENALWLTWRMNDPVTPQDVFKFKQVRAAGGKWPDLGPYALNLSKLAGELCPSVNSSVSGQVANHVRHYYPKVDRRVRFLTFDERIPMAKDLRIRFRGDRGIRFRRNAERPEYFDICLRFVNDGWEWMGVSLRGANEWTVRYLDQLIATDSGPSVGTISLVRRKGKLRWQIAMVRSRFEGEKDTLDAIPGRKLVVWAPADQGVFLRCQVANKNQDGSDGRPWGWSIDGGDMHDTILRQQHVRESMGSAYRQTFKGGRRGHGRRRAIRGQEGMSQRYENRCKDWIENRSAWIVRSAIEARCDGVQMEELTQRDPQRLRLGPFNYFGFVNAVKRKCVDAKIGFSTFRGIEAAKRLLGVG